jgi:GNAT superfamily N-acetyltransferase
LLIPPATNRATEPPGVIPPPNQTWLTANRAAFERLPARTRAVLQRVRFTLADATAMDYAVNVDGLDPLSAARRFMDEHSDDERRVGIGTMLIEAAADAARHFRCHEVRLTTTNDNVDALRFYQRRGFRLAELRPGAVDRSRQEKPQIPRTGDYGIPLHDEIDLTLRV